MKRVRITVAHDPQDPAEDLRRAALARRDLWAHSPVEIDPDSPLHGTHRDNDRNAYFEFATSHYPEVQRVLRECGHEDRGVTAVVVEDSVGTECVSCGNVSPDYFLKCPTCGFRDIEPCPFCNNEIPRLAYTPEAGDLFKCPQCGHRVRLRFNEPLFDSEGHYTEPLVCVSPAEA